MDFFGMPADEVIPYMFLFFTVIALHKLSDMDNDNIGVAA